MILFNGFAFRPQIGPHIYRIYDKSAENIRKFTAHTPYILHNWVSRRLAFDTIALVFFVNHNNHLLRP